MNEYQKAFLVLKEHATFETVDELIVMKELVDKSIPKKVVSNTNIEPYWTCPVCGNFLIEKSEASNLKPFVKHVFLNDYCYKCGQHLDWSKNNE